MFKSIHRMKFHNNSGPFSSAYGILFIAILLIFYGFMYVVDDMLPPALTIAQEKNHPDRFIAERARNDNRELVEIGPRVTGSYENEVLAINYFKKKLSKIQEEAHKNHIIESDFQVVSNFSFTDGLISGYHNIQNIVVKLHAQFHTRFSILVNAHFDTAENSPGASDDGINCAVALEVLRKLSSTSTRFKHNIIFLFNGAEEQGLLGAHGFITQHKWAREVKTFINLDSAGGRGKALLFQAGPKQPWLLKYYSKIRQPFAQVLGEEIYQNRLMPFGTDYSTLTKFYNITGYDFAFMKNHYRYHSKFDDFDSIPLGSYQHIGDIVLDLVQNLANANEVLNYSESAENCVYFDMWGLFFLYYTETSATIINVVIGIFSITINIPSFYHFGMKFSKKYFLYLAIALLSVLSGWILSLAYVLIVSSALGAIGFGLSWNNNLWIILGLYSLPAAAVASGVTYLFTFFKIKEICIERHTQALIHIQRIIWTILVLIGTSLGVRSVYLIEISVFCQTLCFVIVHFAFLYRSEKTWLIIYFIATTISTSLLMKYSFLLSFVFSVLSKFAYNTEIYVALASWSFTILITSAYIPLIHLIKKALIPIGVLMGIHLVFLVIVFTPLGYPYSSDPQSPIQAPFTLTLHIDKQHGINQELLSKNISLEVTRKDRNKWNHENVTDINLENIDSTLNTGDIFYVDRNENQLKSNTFYNFTFGLPNTVFMCFQTNENMPITRIKLLNMQPVDINETSYCINYLRGIQNNLILHLTVDVPPEWSRNVLMLQMSTQYDYNLTRINSPYYRNFFNRYINKTNSISIDINEKWVF